MNDYSILQRAWPILLHEPKTILFLSDAIIVRSTKQPRYEAIKRFGSKARKVRSYTQTIFDALLFTMMFVFLTSNFILDALTIALLYKCRWKIELFFKWIKQHLRIKAFFGTSVNAVKT